MEFLSNTRTTSECSVISTSWSSALCAVTECPCFTHILKASLCRATHLVLSLVQREYSFSPYIHFTHTVSLAFSLTHSVLSICTCDLTIHFILTDTFEPAQRNRFETLTKEKHQFHLKAQDFLYMWYISQSSCNSNFVLLRSTVEHGGQNGTVTFKVEKYEKCHRLGKKEESPATMTGCLLWWETERGCTFQPWPYTER